jgi:Trk K+ transport system NAD-binding subunit
MNVTTIGAGNVGRGIGHWLVSGGQDVTVVDRETRREPGAWQRN